MSKGLDHFKFTVLGTRCPACLRKIQAKLDDMKGLNQSYLDFSSNSIIVDPLDLSKVSEISSAVQKLGFSITPENENTLNHINSVQKKDQIKRLGIAGAMVGNMMLFVVPVYGGLQGPLRNAFLWVSFFLFIPILFYSARPVLRGAWFDFKAKNISVDILISFTAVTITAISLINLLRQSDAVYFDSTASFLFLILVTRYFMEESRIQLLKPIFSDELLPQCSYFLSSGEEIDKSEIQPEHRLSLSSGQWIPVDGVLEAGHGLFSSSYIDGESEPKVFGLNQALRSGLKLVHGKITVRVLTSVRDSQFSKFLQSLNHGQLNNSSSIKSADRLAARLMLVVSLTSILVFISGIWIGFETSIERALALLVIACPCALAFAAPVTVGTFMRKSVLKGIFIKDSSVFEKIKNAQNFFFDKTGTLTDLRMSLKSVSDQSLDLFHQQIILALESNSEHPVAFAIRSAWTDIRANLNLTGIVETPGVGVSGYLGDDLYELKKFDESSHSSDYAIGFFKNSELISELYFENQIRPESFEIINLLKKMGKNIYILSGDRRDRVQQVGRALGLPAIHCFSEVFPEEKEKIISRFSDTVMVGDGINDSLAFKASSVGISVLGEVDAHANVAHVSIAGSGVGQIPQLISFSEKCVRTLNRNYKIALLYNVVGGLMAISGFINPFIAAVAMPLSSSILIISTYRGVR